MRDHAPRRDIGDLLTFGFGIAIAMWAVGYVARIPPGLAPNWLVFTALVACMIGGGRLLARTTGRGLPGALAAGGIAGAVNLLVLGSLLRDDHSATDVALGIGASITISAVLVALGAVLGGRSRRETARDDWIAPFAAVATVATVVLVASGGLVTGFEAGLAVPDWPNSYGRFMFLYPLAKMTGGVYYEHAHRLYGSLVGLTTLVLAIYTWRVDRRPWFRWLVTAALVLVIVQGVMGGLRVTGRPTLSTTDVAPNLTLAVVHGVAGQLFLATLAAITIFATTAWKRDPGPPPAGIESDVSLSTLLGAGLIAQLALGAIVRHFASLTIVHIALGVGLFALGLAAGTRAWASDARPPHVRRLGRLLVIGLSLQILLGIAAVVVTGVLGGHRQPLGVEVPFTSAHQVVGALLLTAAVALALFTRRIAGSPSSAPGP